MVVPPLVGGASATRLSNGLSADRTGAAVGVVTAHHDDGHLRYSIWESGWYFDWERSARAVLPLGHCALEPIQRRFYGYFLYV
jgi:hypothetical protein